ncbi:serine/threonine protein kinase [Eggerthellaceae bacterium zg-887]|uniref:DEAD/DEAH box helicase n=1 Tax=Xiamenia xianingshaonis TaxID=2682776 RepID=UPI00140AD327|nr:DEAD/DEAH box helicase [Xiamenia xianingshaonis]NHM15076.1 serine/threonine protein kinase [Xiamenia xianingshaonis]
MFSADAIRNASGSKTYDRGCELASTSLVTVLGRLRSFDERGNLRLQAKVRSSSGWADYYQVSIVIDDVGDAVLSSSCTCPAHAGNSRVCKHCVAVALAFLHDPRSFLDRTGVLDGAARAGRAGLAVASGGAAASAPVAHPAPARLFPTQNPFRDPDSPADDSETSPELAVLMDRYAPEKTPLRKVRDGGYVEEELTGAWLQPVLTETLHGWKASFKIGHGKTSYVVKSISDLLERVRDRRSHFYGKNLAFTHSLTAFDRRSRLVLGLLQRVEDRIQRSPLDVSFRSRPSQTLQREVDLHAEEVVELLDIQRRADEPIIVEDPALYGRGRQAVRIVREDPALDVELFQEGEQWVLDGGGTVPFVRSGGRLFVLRANVFYDCSPDVASLSEFLTSLYAKGRLQLSAKDVPRFASTLLPALEERLSMHVPDEVRALKPVPCQLEFYFDREAHRVTVEAYANYAGKRIALGGVRSAGRPEGVFDPDNAGGKLCPVRDEAAESAAYDLVGEYFTVDAAQAAAAAGADLDGSDVPFIAIEDEGAMVALLFGGLARFREAGEAFTTAAFDRLLFDREPTIDIGLSLTGDLIDMDVSSSDLDAEDLRALLGSFRKRRKFHRLRSGAYLSLRDFGERRLAQLEQIGDDLGVSDRDLVSGAFEVPAYRAFYLAAAAPDATCDEAFSQLVESFREARSADFAVPPALAGVMRSYQVEGFRWLSLLSECGFGGILADEMGLGKTLQVIAWLLACREADAAGPAALAAPASAAPAGAAGPGGAAGPAFEPPLRLGADCPALVVCPASVVYNWTAEFERFAPGLVVRTLVGTKSERIATRRLPCDVLVTSYDIARIDGEALAEREFFAIVLDEAHYIKNQSAKTTRALKKLRGRHRFALTGTPMENRPSELFSLFDFLMPGYLGSYMGFRERFELGVLGGDEETAERLHRLVGPFVLRRLKADVLTELPDKLETVVRASMGAKQRRLYDAHEQHVREELALQIAESKKRRHERAPGPREHSVEILAELTKLRQLCCDPGLLYEDYTGGAAKVDAIMDLVGSAVEAGEKILVFSQFTSFLSVLAERMRDERIDHFVLTGSTPKRRRLELVNSFNAGATPVFLVSLKAGGTGLNLTGASVVIHADPWWNASVQNQATDRAHRIGQDRVVNVFKVIASGTIEERMVCLQEKKLALADGLIGGEGMSLAALTDDDLLDLLSSAG